MWGFVRAPTYDSYFDYIMMILTFTLTWHCVLSDIDECQVQRPCGFGSQCVNTWGGYSCITGVFGRKCLPLHLRDHSLSWMSLKKRELMAMGMGDVLPIAYFWTCFKYVEFDYWQIYFKNISNSSVFVTSMWPLFAWLWCKLIFVNVSDT